MVVLSPELRTTLDKLSHVENVKIYCYKIPNSFKTILLGRDTFLDNLVINHRVDAVLTIFGPSRWKPKVPHLSGFAIPHLLFPESPYFEIISRNKLIWWTIYGHIILWSLKRSADCFWTENPNTSERLLYLLKTKKVYTISNYYNQVFDQPWNWKKSITLPEFNGTTCLSVASPYPHKNFGIIEVIVRHLREEYPELKVRFVLTCKETDWPMAEDVKGHVVYIGKIDVSECPYLYEQADVMFMPSLLECFSATYPEAMRMEVPIVTTNLDFSVGLCADAACYYNAVDPKAAAEAIIKVATDKEYAKQLVRCGKKHLLTYDNYEQRADKLIDLLEDLAKN